ncbi:MAG TPA: hypothetical protein VJ783_27965 [Pirellulales bacterium]|nr:hypothetical protein [Pirellulales bacterium]
MKLNKSTAALDYKLVTAFKEVRQQLLQPKFADRLDKPLAHWVIGSDRRLPLAFLDHSLRELLNTPFDDLFSTAGIGHKKIRTFLMLLNRAARPHPLGALRTAESDLTEAQPSVVKDANGLPVPQVVSEALWVRWRENVRRHGLEREPLGRYVGTLRDLPRVIWYKPLGDYAPLTLAQVRALKTHGAKRVRAVLEAFGSLHRILLYLDPDSRLAVRIVPRWLLPIEDWVVGRLNDSLTPTKHEIRKSLIVPLLEQVRVDAGKTIARLVERRLKSPAAAVRQAAEQMGVTRARVYQLLSEASDVVNVRWPAGAALVARLREKMRAEGADAKLLDWMDEVIDLFFLRSHSRSAADLETTASRDAHRNGHAHGGNGASRTNGHRTSPKPAHQRPAGNARQPDKRATR